MTLAELHRKCKEIGHQLTDENLQLKMYGKDCQVNLELCGNNGNYWVEVRPSIEHDEQLAIIMQMFGDGNDFSIATVVANQIKQATIEKAVEWLSKQYLFYFNVGNGAFYRDTDLLVEQFRKAMEKL